jgi:putative phosphoribosyl transferase
MFREPAMFKDRLAAGKALGRMLTPLRKEKPVVICLPATSATIGRVVADHLEGDLDYCLIGRITGPLNPELTCAAVTERGDLFLSRKRSHGLPLRDIEKQRVNLLLQLRQARTLYLNAANSSAITTIANPVSFLVTSPAVFVTPCSSLKRRYTILVDDGIVTGLTMIAAIHIVEKYYKPSHLLIAVPFCVTPEAMTKVAKRCDDLLVMYSAPSPKDSLKEFYVEYPPTLTDLEIIESLTAHCLRNGSIGSYDDKEDQKDPERFFSNNNDR